MSHAMKFKKVSPSSRKKKRMDAIRMMEEAVACTSCKGET